VINRYNTKVRARCGIHCAKSLPYPYIQKSVYRKAYTERGIVSTAGRVTILDFVQFLRMPTTQSSWGGTKFSAIRLFIGCLNIRMGIPRK